MLTQLPSKNPRGSTFWWLTAEVGELIAHRDELAERLNRARKRGRKTCSGSDFREHCQTYQALRIANRRLAQLGIEGAGE